MTLLPHHAAMLEASAISSEIAEARGYRSIEKKADLKRLGYSDVQALAPTLFVPIWSPCDREDPSYHHHRPDAPRMRDGKPVKYEFPAKSSMVIDVHPHIRTKTRDPRIPLLITEGCRKEDAAISAGLCCIALVGVWNWRGRNEFGGKTTLPDLDEIAWKDKADQARPVYLCFDSDAMVKRSVYEALQRISGVLQRRGADLAYIYLPHGPDGVKWGLDDYLAAGHTTDQLLALASADLRPLPVEPNEEETETYRETPRGLVWLRATKDGVLPTPLSTFTARIIADLVTDDGAETSHEYQIQARCRDRCKTFTIPLQQFDALAWPAEHLGTGAYLSVGNIRRDHARVAIRELSGEVPEMCVYTHIGWRELAPGVWGYLHAGGVISEATGANVRLSGVLTHYSLPDPPEGDALQRAICAVLRLLDLAPDPLTFPLLTGVFRAAIGAGDFALALAGKTGVFKSELASLAQRFFGREMGAKNLPGSWSSTENALEDLAFLVKDALLVVDDFCPVGSSMDVQRLHAKADRVLRAQGNGSGRQRMRRDGSLRPERPPRGLILSTGEDVPQGQSLQARMLLLEVKQGDIAEASLTACQQDAAAGLYAACMSSFLRWLAPRYPHVSAALPGDVERTRAQVALSGHRRTPGIVAELFCGLELFLGFAIESGAISEEQKTEFRNRGWVALLAAGQAQSGFHQGSEPTARFLELLRGAISSGAAHVAATSGDKPETPAAWGWRFRGNEFGGEWIPQGARVGYVDAEDVYLIPDVAFSVAKRLGEESGNGLAMTPTTLWKRLREGRFLASVDEKRETLLVRRKLDGSTQNVLHLSAPVLCSQKPDIPDIPDIGAASGSAMR